MCQAVQVTHKSCGCNGEFYRTICPKPTATCKRLRGKITHLPISSACEKHTPPLEGARERELAAEERRGQIHMERWGEIRQRQKKVTEFWQKEREMEAFGQRFGQEALRRKYPIAQQRYDDAQRRKAQEQEIMQRARARAYEPPVIINEKPLGFRETRCPCACVVM